MTIAQNPKNSDSQFRIQLGSQNQDNILGCNSGKLMSEREAQIDNVRRYYGEKVKQHGPTAQGVDWRDEESQRARFHQLALLIGSENSASLADIGCGYGALAPFLRRRGWNGHYEGVDVSPEMIEAARAYLKSDTNLRLTIGQLPVERADFVVASGIFNVKGTVNRSAWERYVCETIDRIVKFAEKGVAFNCLTSWSDAPCMRDDLYYAAPEKIFAYCASRHSRWLELSQDYGLFEFTVRLRLDREAPRLRRLEA